MPVVMVSSTVKDLSDYRQKVLDACMKQGMFPEMKEYLPAKDGNATAISLELVNRADLYLGVFAHRYGHVPRGSNISITELEYNRARERNIPCLIFLMSDQHRVLPSDFEQGEGAARLHEFKEKLKANHVVTSFTSPEDLEAKILHSLSAHLAGHLLEKSNRLFEGAEIATAPDPYIAHPYLLLQTPSLIGRRSELKMLTDWVSNPASDLYPARILNIVGIGGMGKSALTWEWFNDIAPKVIKPCAGRIWWSFQESDALFENFITSALSYVTGIPTSKLRAEALSQRESKLLGILDRQPFLLVLDGFERVLIAYDRRSGTFKGALDNQVNGSPLSFAGTDPDDYRLRKTADPRLGFFLRKLAQVRATRVLISTRLYPADLQTAMQYPIPRSDARSLSGLSDEDAVNFWRALRGRGSRRELLRFFRIFDNYPLLIQLMAGVIARYRRKPGNFDHWRKNHPSFNPFKLKLEHGNSEVFNLALSGLRKVPRSALNFIAALRIPCTYDTLVSFLVRHAKLFANEDRLNSVLTELEDRGLLGWDAQANRYDLHPVVRGVVWDEVSEDDKKEIYEALYDFLESIPLLGNNQIKSIENLLPLTERYHALVNLKRYKEAIDLFYEHLNEVTLYRFSASRHRAELLELLFPSGIGKAPALRYSIDRAFIFNALGATYLTGGKPGLAAAMYRRHNLIQEKLQDKENLCVGLGNLSNALRQSGRLFDAEAAASASLDLARELPDPFLEAVSLGWLGISLGLRGVIDKGELYLRQTLGIYEQRKNASPEVLLGRHDASAEATARAFLARLKLWQNHAAEAQPLVDSAWQLVSIDGFERYVVLVRRMQGAVALAKDDFGKAEELLNRALADARAIDLVVEEVLALLELAELHLKRGDTQTARELLGETWELVEEGPYPLFHVDAYNLLTLIEQREGNAAEAIAAATRAYRLAWCDGPPFTYHWGLETARKLLENLGATPT